MVSGKVEKGQGQVSPTRNRQKHPSQATVTHRDPWGQGKTKPWNSLLSSQRSGGSPVSGTSKEAEGSVWMAAQP